LSGEGRYGGLGGAVSHPRAILPGPVTGAKVPDHPPVSRLGKSPVGLGPSSPGPDSPGMGGLWGVTSGMVDAAGAGIGIGRRPYCMGGGDTGEVRPPTCDPLGRAGRRVASAQTAQRYPGAPAPHGPGCQGACSRDVHHNFPTVQGQSGSTAGAALLPKSPPWPRSVISKRAQSGPAYRSTDALSQVRLSGCHWHLATAILFFLSLEAVWAILSTPPMEEGLVTDTL
jgi:hypothetical protein